MVKWVTGGSVANVLEWARRSYGSQCTLAQFESIVVPEQSIGTIVQLTYTSLAAITLCSVFAFIQSANHWLTHSILTLDLSIGACT